MEVSEKLQKTKKLGKIFKIVSIAASVLAVFFVVFYCLAPATRLTTDIGKYAKHDSGRLCAQYVGFQL